MTKSKRDRLRRVYSILVCCRTGPVLSEDIQRRCNLNSVSFNFFVGGLVSCGFLSKSYGGGHVFFVTSRLGLDFIRRYVELQSVGQPLIVVFGDVLS